MTIQDVAQVFGLSWNSVKRIDKEDLEKNYQKPRLKEVEQIAIDEFAVRKGHNYMTVVLDLDKMQVLYVAEGRASEVLNKFWKRVKTSGAKIKAVAMDMWPAYIVSVIENLPKAKIIFDRFHIVKNLNEALSDIRREIYRDETEYNKKQLLKGTRWLLLKKEENLDTEKDEKKRLDEALRINAPLAASYYLKEELSLLWQQKSREDAEKFLGKWVAKAYATGIFRLRKFANMLLAHRSGIFNWFDFPISTSPLEGINNKIKVLKRRAYGYRDMCYFKLKILAMHENRYALW